MRITCVPAALGMAVAALAVVPVVLVAAPSAHADLSGYRRCLGTVKNVPLSSHDPANAQLVGQVQMDLKSGVSPSAEAQRLSQQGFDPGIAGAIVQCVIEENP